MSPWEDEGSPLLDFLWDLGSVHMFSGELYLTRKFSHVLIIPTKGLLVSRELGQEKSELGFSIGHTFMIKSLENICLFLVLLTN